MLVHLSIDAEALPARHAAESGVDALDALMWGKFGGEEYGLGRMMDLADAHGLQLSVYLEYCEYLIYGESLLDVAREVDRRGHDVQVHVHADMLAPDSPIYCGRGRPALNNFDSDQAARIADWMVELSLKAIGKQPVAFRGGAFRFNQAVLEAFGNVGFEVSANFHPHAKYWDAPRPYAKPFLWPNGMLELPLPMCDMERPRVFIFEDYPVESPDALAAFASEVAKLPGNLNIFTHLLHSWSLLQKDEQGRFSAPALGKVERMDAFFRSITQSFTAAQALMTAKEQELSTAQYSTIFSPRNRAAREGS